MININKKAFLRFLSLLIALIVLIVGISGLNISAADVDVNLIAVNVNPNEFNLGKTNFDDALCDYIVQQVSEHTENINISDYNVNVSEVSNLFMTVLYNNPQLFFVNPLGYNYTKSGSKIVSIVPTYLYDDQETAEKSAIFEEKVNKLISGIDSSWDDELKALTIHDNLIINCEYATKELSDPNNDNIDIYTAYGALVNKRAVCQGYTLAFNYMLSKFGIDTAFISSHDMNHAWSMVKIDGNYYHTDVTWDDPVNDKLGQAYHTYFLKSDNAFLNDTSLNKHYNWASDYKAKSTLYDNYFWNNIKTIIPYIDGNYYYISNQSDDIGNIIKYDGQNKSSVLKIDEKWYIDSSNTLYWTTNYSYLAAKNGRLYYNTPDKIYSAKLDGTNQKLEYTINSEQAAKGYIYGIKLKSDGYLYISVTDNPQNESTNYKTVKVSEDNIVPSTSQPMSSKPTSPEPPVSNEILIGDVDLDSDINVKDATLIQLYSANFNTLNTKQLLAADVDNSIDVNVKDATYIQMYCANIKGGEVNVGIYKYVS